MCIRDRIKAYPNCNVKKAAFVAFQRHLWFFSEHLVGLALFDSRVSDDTKIEMVKNLQRPPKAKALKRVESKSLQHEESSGDILHTANNRTL